MLAFKNLVLKMSAALFKSKDGEFTLNYTQNPAYRLS